LKSLVCASQTDLRHGLHIAVGMAATKLASTPKAGVQGTQSLAGARGVLATLPSFFADRRPARRSMSGSQNKALDKNSMVAYNMDR